jgi:hypothetical protein
MFLTPETARCLLDGDPNVVALLLKEELVPGVGVEPKATLKIRKLLLLLSEKKAKNCELALARYTAGTRIPESPIRVNRQ